jgi:hypothetical protein
MTAGVTFLITKVSVSDTVDPGDHTALTLELALGLPTARPSTLRNFFGFVRRRSAAHKEPDGRLESTGVSLSKTLCVDHTFLHSDVGTSLSIAYVPVSE